MSETICPACKSDNDGDAAYCDQCGQPLRSREAAAASDDGAPESDGCPACGGEVQDLGDGDGRCRACGLELAAAPEAEHDEASGTIASALTAAILAKVRVGVPIDQAVSESCLKVLRSAGVDAAQPAPTGDVPLGRACPVCGADCPAGVERCPECAVWFSSRHRPGPCPSCGETADGDKCACGAALTVPAIAAALERNVKFLCSTCKQPFVSRPEKCPDCGGALISADRLRAGL